MLNVMSRDARGGGAAEGEESEAEEEEEEGAEEEEEEEGAKTGEEEAKGSEEEEKVSPMKGRRARRAKPASDTLSTIKEDPDNEFTMSRKKRSEMASAASSVASPSAHDGVSTAVEDEPDREDISGLDESVEQSSVDASKMLTFAGRAPTLEDEMLSKNTTLESIREYLEGELGERIVKAYPVLREFGDNIFYDEKTVELVKQLDGLLSENEVRRYQQFFATLVFMEEEAEKLRLQKEEKEMRKRREEFDKTATFGIRQR